jgi:hypothetical protein
MTLPDRYVLPLIAESTKHHSGTDCLVTAAAAKYD